MLGAVSYLSKQFWVVLSEGIRLWAVRRMLSHCLGKGSKNDLFLPSQDPHLESDLCHKVEMWIWEPLNRLSVEQKGLTRLNIGSTRNNQTNWF